MENFYTISFWLLASASVACGLWLIFENNLCRAVKTAGAFFALCALLIFLLQAPLVAILEFLIFGAVFAVLNILARLTAAQEEKSFVFNFKTLLAPFLGIIFIVILAPFLFLTFASFTSTGAHGFFGVLEVIFKNGIFWITTGIIFLITACIGISSVLNIKNLQRKIKGLKAALKDINEENTEC